MEKMLSFFGEPKLKEAVRRRVAEHQKHDEVVQGLYWTGSQGCFIGCSLHSGRHGEFQSLLGLPVWLARLGEQIFEGLPLDEAKKFPLALYDAIPVGVDLDAVKFEFCRWVCAQDAIVPLCLELGLADPSYLSKCGYIYGTDSSLSFAGQAKALMDCLRAAKPDGEPVPALPETVQFQTYYQTIQQEAAKAI